MANLFTAPDATRVDRSDEFGVAVRALWGAMGMKCASIRSTPCIRDEEGVHFTRCATACVEVFEGYVAAFANSEAVRLRAYKEQTNSPTKAEAER